MDPGTEETVETGEEATEGMTEPAEAASEGTTEPAAEEAAPTEDTTAEQPAESTTAEATAEASAETSAAAETTTEAAESEPTTTAGPGSPEKTEEPEKEIVLETDPDKIKTYVDSLNPEFLVNILSEMAETNEAIWGELNTKYQGDENRSKVFVRGINYETNDESFEAAFKKFGQVVEATIVKDRHDGRSKGFGFVTFQTPHGAQKALEESSLTLDDRNLSISRIVPLHQRMRGRGNFGGAGFRGGRGMPRGGYGGYQQQAYGGYQQQHTGYGGYGGQGGYAQGGWGGYQAGGYSQNYGYNQGGYAAGYNRGWGT